MCARLVVDAGGEGKIPGYGAGQYEETVLTLPLPLHPHSHLRVFPPSPSDHCSAQTFCPPRGNVKLPPSPSHERAQKSRLGRTSRTRGEWGAGIAIGFQSPQIHPRMRDAPFALRFRDRKYKRAQARGRSDMAGDRAPLLEIECRGETVPQARFAALGVSRYSK